MIIFVLLQFLGSTRKLIILLGADLSTLSHFLF